MDEPAMVRASALRAPRAAAVAGIAFALLLGAAIVLIRAAVPADPSEAGEWVTDDGRKALVALALSLVPFAGIAFLWFIGVVRDRIGRHEDRLFATVFLGSGLLFIAMIFAAAAVAGGLLADAARGTGGASSQTWAFGRSVTFTLLNVYGMRMGAVFVLSTTTIVVRTRILPRWIGIAGYLVAAALLFGVGLLPWLNLLLPVWVLILSLHILLFRRPGSDDAETGEHAGPVG